MIEHRPRRLIGALSAVLIVAAAGTMAGALPAAAADVTTDYPVVEVQAGQDATIALHLAAASTERVALSVEKAPSGWSADLEGGGFTIGGVYVGPDQTPAVNLHVTVPDDAKTGAHHVIVAARGPDGTKRLDLQFDVVAEASDAYALTSDFAQLQGTTKDTFTFSLTLANHTGADASFGLTASGPQGWTVTAAPSAQNKASAVDVDAGGSADITVTATPPANVKADTYPIQVVASGAGQKLTEKLSVEVTGSATLSMSTADQVLNASGSAGGTTDVHLKLENTGSAPLTGVTMASTPPSGWTVTFEPKTVDEIQPGDSTTVVARIQPTGDAITGDYQVTLSANSDASDASVDLRYTVQTSTWWGLVGVVVIAAAIVVLLWLFRRYGRR